VFRPQGPACDVRAYEYVPTHESESAAIEQLGAEVAALGLERGMATALRAKLDEALASLAAGDTQAACVALQDFSQVNAQSGSKISTTAAALLIDEATRIRALLAC
jgi:hypothetical protein